MRSRVSSGDSERGSAWRTTRLTLELPRVVSSASVTSSLAKRRIDDHDGFGERLVPADVDERANHRCRAQTAQLHGETSRP